LSCVQSRVSEALLAAATGGKKFEFFFFWQLRLVQCIHVAAWFVRQVTQQRRRHRVRSTKYGFDNTYRTAVLQYDIYCTGHSGNYVWYNIYYSLVIVRDKSCGITATGGKKKNPQTPAYYEITIENGCTADF